MYSLEIEKVIEEIKNSNAKRVLLQLPEGLKPKAKEIVDSIEVNCDCEVFIWFGDCFGACDLPLGIDELGIDIVFHFGHNEFRRKW